ncbi:MAG: GIY-YIG nuclease family protein [Candidatus Aminicenantes bacterium]|nr:GIY-YIG nuclease family protein [Candidatus Aminicenantes bacterium]
MNKSKANDVSQGFSLRIFMPDGNPDGLKIIEKSNWTGQGILFPRTIYPQVRIKQDLNRTGVYIIWGPDQKGELPRIYIGEGDPVLPRLDQHMRNKDFWTHAVVFISKDLNLNKAHVQYLESRLVKMANEAKRCILDNSNLPQLPSLSEADTADIENFLSEMLLCVPIMGINFFEKPKIDQSRIIRLFIKSKGITAEGYESPGGFIVCEQSQAVKSVVPSAGKYLKGIRQHLTKNEVLVDKGEYYLFKQDYAFNSPSTAAGVILGRESNGRVEWKDAKGRTLKDIQTEEIK